MEKLEDIPKDELKGQFKIFVFRLGKITAKYSLHDLKDLDTRMFSRKFAKKILPHHKNIKSRLFQ